MVIRRPAGMPLPITSPITKALVIGDVMGKGIPAGLLMTMLRGMLRAEVLTGLPPDRILHDLNQLAINDLDQSHRFVTLFYSDYDPRTRKMRFAN